MKLKNQIIITVVEALQKLFQELSYGEKISDKHARVISSCIFSLKSVLKKESESDE